MAMDGKRTYFRSNNHLPITLQAPQIQPNPLIRLSIAVELQNNICLADT